MPLIQEMVSSDVSSNDIKFNATEMFIYEAARHPGAKGETDEFLDKINAQMST